MVHEISEAAAGNTSQADPIAGLLRRVAVGDRASFAELYDLMSPQMFGLIRHELGEGPQSDQTLSARTLQDAFLEVWRTADDFDPQRDAGRLWLMAIAHRRAATGAGTAVANDRRDVPAVAPPTPLRAMVLASLDAIIDAGEGPSALGGQQVGFDAAVDRGHAAAAAAAPTTARAQLNLSNRRNGDVDDGADGAAYGGRVDDPDDADDAAPRRRRVGIRLLAVVAVAALIIGLGSGLFTALQPDRYSNANAIEQIAAAADAQITNTTVAGGGEASLVWSATQGRAVLTTAGMNPAPPEHTYELWFVRGNERISGGTFEPSGEGETAVFVAGQIQAGDVIAATIEVAGGAPDGVPSDRQVFALTAHAGGQPA